MKLLFVQFCPAFSYLLPQYTVLTLSSQMSDSASLSNGRWLMFMEEAKSIEEFFSDIYVPFDSEFVVAQSSSGLSNEDYEVSLTEVYKVQSTLPLQKNRIANWSSVSGLSWTTVDLHQRRDLEGVVMRCVFLPEVRTFLRICILVSKCFKCVNITYEYPDILIKDNFFPKQPPYLTVGRYNGKAPADVSGYSIELMKILQYRLNYTYVIIAFQ
jgi:hypothetical protein